MKYGIIAPAFNEAPYIKEFMQSVIGQTILPAGFVIVDDGSTDQTASIARNIASEYDWITVLNRPVVPCHQIGSKVVEAFRYGLDKASHNDWEIVVKLDSDQILPADYFEQVIRTFNNDSKAGICGGVCTISLKQPVGKELQVEKLTDRFHVRGSLKSYRIDCYRDIGGLSPVYGWDTLDELLAEYYGWKIKVLPQLKVIHQRPTGTKTRPIRLHLMTGEFFYRTGYRPFISLIASLKRYRMPPFGVSALVSWIGYLKASIRRPDRYVDKEQMQFINRLRYRRIGIKLKEMITFWSK